MKTIFNRILSMFMCIGIVISMTMPIAYAGGGTNVGVGDGEIGRNEGSWYNSNFGGKYNGIRVSVVDKTASLRAFAAQ